MYSGVLCIKGGELCIKLHLTTLLNYGIVHEISRFIRGCLFLKAMISAIQTEEVYSEYKTPDFANTRSTQGNLRPKSYFANAKVFSGITSRDLPPLRDNMHKIDD